MKFKEKFEAILQKLGLIDKAKSGKLTSEDWKNIESSYKDEYKTDMHADMQEENANLKKAEERDAILKVLEENKTETTASNTDDKSGKDGKEKNKSSDDKDKTNKDDKDDTNITDKVEGIIKENKDLKDKVEKLSKKVEEDNPQTVKNEINIVGMPHSETHLFGIQHELYDRNKRWNGIYISRRLPDETPSKETAEAFENEVVKFGQSIHKRMVALHKEGLLNKEGLKKTSDVVTYSDLSGAGLGDQFVVRRQDLLIARIVELPSVENIFPTRYGVQDKELITNAFLDDFSQAYQVGEVSKGGVTLKPEMGYVDDAMMKTLFESLKWIERQYIGYLNTNGSDPIKWNLIEWMILNIATKLMMEKFQRAITGIYIKPETDVAGHILNAGTGVVYTLLRYINEYKILPFDDAAYATYDGTGTVFVDLVEDFVNEVRLILPSLSGYAIYLNENHKKWYASGYRSKYGTDMDFMGQETTIKDDGLSIIWVPNMGQLKFVWMAQPGNIQKLEYLPGEMASISFEQRMHAVWAWSVWKEGTTAAYSGKKFDTLAELVADARANQVIFINKPVTTLSADDTTPDGASNFWLKTPANTGATAITDIDNAKAGVAYVIEIGSATNPSNIAKSGKFANITAAWTPTDVGDYIMVILNSAGDGFLELERRVGGTRTINSALQPNITTV